MLSLTVLAMAVAVTSALPRGELGMEEGNLYPPGLYRDQTVDEKDGRNLDSLGGGNLLRDLEAVLRTHPNLFYGRSARNHDTLDSLSGITFGSQKRFDSLSPAYAADKRNFDEIDRTGFNSFIKKKKNFDEIDRSGFDGFVKRNFDEIDRVGFGSFIKKSGDPRH